MSAERAAPALLAVLALTLGATVPGAVPPAVAAARGGPHVQVMIVGRHGAILSQARTVAARATAVRVGRRSCAVAAGTPLAVLAAARRTGAPPFALRDYGRCGSSPRNSGQLFVYSLAGESNRGQDGWEYKVEHVSGSTGAADPSGPLGDGRRLGSGQRVLWFWCVASGGGCQRTLDLTTSAATVSPGSSLAVTVVGYDNEGHGVPVGGAIVTLGTASASTGADGRATLIAPAAPGRYTLGAARPGLAPAFPDTIAVR